MKTDLFQSCGHCWVFQICWHIECSTFTASSLRIWNRSTGIPSRPLALLQDPTDFTVHRILQVGILEWVAVPFSRGSFQHRDRTQVSHICRWILYQLSHQWSSQTCKHAKIWILGSIPILLNSNNGVELMSMWLNKLSMWLQCTLKFENYIRKAISFDYPTNMSTTFNN